MDCSENIGQLIAVATFSNARKWIKEGKEIRSYEWVRYASLPDLRVSGGMGRLLKTFINEVQPDDIMSYADLEWSEGRAYKALGFMEDAAKDPAAIYLTEMRFVELLNRESARQQSNTRYTLAPRD